MMIGKERKYTGVYPNVKENETITTYNKRKNSKWVLKEIDNETLWILEYVTNCEKGNNTISTKIPRKEFKITRNCRNQTQR